MIVLLITSLILLVVGSILFLIQTSESYKKNKPLQFIHIPKTGGTSIEDSAKKEGVLWGRYNNDLKGMLNGKTKWHTPPYKLKNIYFNKDIIPFTIVRNPYTRLVSEFNYELNYRKALFSKYNDINEFVKTLDNSKEFDRMNNICDNHLLPQTQYTKNVKEILYFENLNNDFRKLLKKYNYPNIKLLHKNKSKSKFTINDLNEESINIIRKIYKDDFKKLGYLQKKK